MNVVKKIGRVTVGVLALLVALVGFVVGLGFAITIIGLLVALPIWLGSAFVAIGGFTLISPEFGRRLDEQFRARRLAHSRQA